MIKRMMRLLALTFGTQVVFEVFPQTNDVISGAYFQADVAYGVKDHFICFVQAWLFRENT